MLKTSVWSRRLRYAAVALATILLLWLCAQPLMVTVMQRRYQNVVNNLQSSFRNVNTKRVMCDFFEDNKTPLKAKKADVVMYVFVDGKKWTETGHNGEESLRQRSLKNKQAYAELHGYGFYLSHPEDIDRSRPAPWRKVLDIKKLLKSYEYVMYVDLDTVILNENIKLESIIYANEKTMNADFIMTKDPHGPNSGVFFARRSEWTMSFLDQWYGVTDFDTAPWYTQYPFLYEQRGLHYLYSSDYWIHRGMPRYDHYETVRPHFTFVPQCTMNSYVWIGNVNMAHLIVHLAGYSDYIKREKMDFFLKKSIPERQI